MTTVDTNDNSSSHLTLLKAKGVTAVGRYYSSSAWKRLTKTEAQALDAAGISIFVVFENSGDPQLTSDSGLHDAQIALAQAKAVGQPHGSAIYFALEHLPNGYTSQHIPKIEDYVRGLKNGLGDNYKIGIYSDGVICAALLDAGLCDYTWLSASRSFAGSLDFYKSKRWSIAQDPHVDQDWDGMSIDLNETNGAFGAFTLAGPVGGDSGVHAAELFDEFAASACVVAGKEWEFFGNQTFDLVGHTAHTGHKEGDDGYYQRVGTYWIDGTGTHGIDGRNHDVPWSAAFISWVMRTSGAGDRFRYSTQHSVYISQAIRDFANKREAAGYWAVRLPDAAPKIGDLVCWAREAGVDYDHQKQGNYKGHSDLVVAVELDEIFVIGGNVGNSVTKRPLKRNSDGTLFATEQGGETLFALMQCRL